MKFSDPNRFARQLGGETAPGSPTAVLLDVHGKVSRVGGLPARVEVFSKSFELAEDGTVTLDNGVRYRLVEHEGRDALAPLG